MEAKTRLSALVERALEGEEMVLTRRGDEPAVRLVLWRMAGEASRIGKRALAALGSDGVDPIVGAVTIWEAPIEGVALASDGEMVRRYDIEVVW